MRLIDEIMNEIKDVMDKLDESQLEKAMDLLSKDNAIFVDGEGRSGFQARGFAMRLMHIGYQPYVMGETITPALKQNQVYVAISGSGKTKNTVSNTAAAEPTSADDGRRAGNCGRGLRRRHYRRV